MRDREYQLFQRIEIRRGALLAEADRLGVEQLTFRAEPNSWSTLDVLEHLVKVEEGIAERVRVREPRTWREAARAKAALGAMRVVFGLRRRVKVPVQGVLPLGGVTLSDLVRRWEAAQATLRTRLEAFGPGDWSRPMMRHPLIGLLTPAEGLAFIHWHMGHHRRQIARIRRAAGYPGS